MPVLRCVRQANAVSWLMLAATAAVTAAEMIAAFLLLERRIIPANVWPIAFLGAPWLTFALGIYLERRISNAVLVRGLLRQHGVIVLPDDLDDRE